MLKFAKYVLFSSLKYCTTLFFQIEKKTKLYEEDKVITLNRARSIVSVILILFHVSAILKEMKLHSLD